MRFVKQRFDRVSYIKPEDFSKSINNMKAGHRNDEAELKTKLTETFERFEITQTKQNISPKPRIEFLYENETRKKPLSLVELHLPLKTFCKCHIVDIIKI